MQQSGVEFLELLNDKDKERKTCLLVLLQGDVEAVRELGPAEQWCFHPEQTWNRCYTARYSADGKGAVVAPLIRQLCGDLSSRVTSKRLEPASKMRTAGGSPDWSHLEEALSTQGAKWAELSDQQLIESFGRVLQQALHQGQRLVLFCEVDEDPQGLEDALRLDQLGLGRDALTQLQEWLPERFALVLAGINRPGPRAIDERIVQLRLGSDYYETQPPQDRSQPLASDEPRGDDTLDIESEVNALADAIAARDMTPPFVVGVLGGWGAGKSFVLNLLAKRLLAIRKKNILDAAVRSGFPYAGHFYLVRFDAWTYAKADLWASLMHKLLIELNDQIAYEQLSVLSYRQLVEKQARIGEEEAAEEGAKRDRQELRMAEEEEVQAFLRKADMIIGNTGIFDEQSMKELWKRLRPDELHPDPDDLTLAYYTQKRRLFDRMFEIVLKGEDDFTPDVVEALRAGDIDTSGVLQKLENDVLWSRLQGLNSSLRKALKNQEAELKKGKSKLEDQRAKLEETVDVELRVTRWGTWSANLAGVLGVQFRKAVDSRLEKARKRNQDAEKSKGNAGNDVADIVADVPFEEAIASLGIIRMAFAGRSLRTLAIFVFFLLAGAVVAGVTTDVADGWIKLSLSSVGGILTGGVEAWRRANAWMRGQAEAFQAFDESVRNEQQARREALIDEKKSVEPAYQQQVKRVAHLQAKVESLNRKVGLTAGHETLIDFIAHRLEDDAGYTERLGLLHQVQADIQELTDGLFSDALCVRNRDAKSPEDADLNREQGRDLELTGTNLEKVLFPRGEPRVVLFIDDLDRCPPSRVVEVLEAAQLLVKTKLFVVVIAMDVRYVTKALEKAYEGVLDRRGAPSGLDYIEKIIQVPYRIRPISRDAMPGYLRLQTLQKTEPAPGLVTEIHPGGPGAEGPVSGIFAPSENRARIDETIPQKVLAFDDDELNLIETCALAANISPRATKRLLNVMKLIKTIWYRGGDDDVSLETKKAVVFFLTLSARYPEVIRRVLVELERIITETSSPDYRKPIHDLLERIAEEWESIEGRRIEWRNFRSAASNKELLSEHINIEQLGSRNIELIRSFSFVGEIDLQQDPGVHQVSLQLHDPVEIAQTASTVEDNPS